MEGSVRVYSRDDIGPQAEVINRIRSGCRSLQPVARSSAKPLPDFLVSLPPPDGNLAGEAPRDDRVRDAASSAGSDSGLSADSSDSDATAASDSDLESALRSKAKQPPASRSGEIHDDLRASHAWLLLRTPSGSRRLVLSLSLLALRVVPRHRRCHLIRGARLRRLVPNCELCLCRACRES